MQEYEAVIWLTGREPEVITGDINKVLRKVQSVLGLRGHNISQAYEEIVDHKMLPYVFRFQDYTGWNIAVVR